MDAEGWVLAGGRSRRMGRDKAAVMLAGRPLLAHMLRKLQMLDLPARVAGLRDPVPGVTASFVTDAHPDCGPLSGMETALRESKAELVLILGVDLPLLETNFLAWMLGRARITGAVATIPRLVGEPQPLCAVYRRGVLNAIADALASGDYKVMRAVERAGSLPDLFDVETLSAAGAWDAEQAPHHAFLNCNTQEDLARIGSMIA